MNPTDANEPELVEVAATTAAVIAGVVPLAELPDFFDRSFTALAALVPAQGVAFTGPAFARYHGPPGEVADLEVGFPADRAVVADGDVVPGSLPGGRVARLVHQGAYDELGSSWSRLGAWIAEQGLAPGGDLWEVYETEPTPEMDPRELVTVLHWTLAD